MNHRLREQGSIAKNIQTGLGLGVLGGLRVSALKVSITTRFFHDVTVRIQAFHIAQSSRRDTRQGHPCLVVSITWRREYICVICYRPGKCCAYFLRYCLGPVRSELLFSVVVTGDWLEVVST